MDELLLKTETTLKLCCLEKNNSSGIFIPILDFMCSFDAAEF